MYIRPSVMEDFPQILELYRQARVFMKDNGNERQWGDSYPDPELVRRDIAEGNSYVCEEEQDGETKILAVFFYSMKGDLDYGRIDDGAWLDTAPYGVIHRIASPSGRKGAASFCIRWAFEQCASLRMDTHQDNIPMQRLLEKNGFIRCGTVYVRDGSARIAYQKISEKPAGKKP